MGAAEPGRFRTLFDVHLPDALHTLSVISGVAIGTWLLARWGVTRPLVGATPFLGSPGSVRVAPAFEVGAAEPGAQHLVENTTRGGSPPCITLDAVQRGWRLWRIDP